MSFWSIGWSARPIRRRALPGGILRQHLDDPAELIRPELADQPPQAVDRLGAEPLERGEQALDGPCVPAHEELDAAVESAHELEQRPESSAEAGHLVVQGVAGRGGPRLVGAALDHRDNGVGLALFARGGDATEPLPMVADHAPRDGGGAALAGSSRSVSALDQPPLLALGEGQARRAVAHPERATDFGLRLRTIADEEVALDRGRGRRDAPGGPDRAPGHREGPTQLFGCRLGTRTKRATHGSMLLARGSARRSPGGRAGASGRGSRRLSERSHLPWREIHRC